MSLVAALAVATGAGVGAALRYLAAHRLDGRWPLGTLLVNVLGSTAVGALAAAGLAGNGWALLGVGLCGGMTTWSGLAVQVHDLGWLRGGAYAAASLGLALGGCAAAHWLVSG